MHQCSQSRYVTGQYVTRVQARHLPHQKCQVEHFILSMLSMITNILQSNSNSAKPLALPARDFPKAATAPLRQTHDVWSSSSLKLPSSYITSFIFSITVRDSIIKAKCPVYRPTHLHPSTPTPILTRRRRRRRSLLKQLLHTLNPPPQSKPQQQPPLNLQTPQLRPQPHQMLLYMPQHRMRNQERLPLYQYQQHQRLPLLQQRT